MSTGIGGFSRSRVWSVVLPLTAAVCAFGATEALAEILMKREGHLAHTRAEAEAEHVAAQLRSGIQKALQVLPQLGSWWLSQGRPMAREDWDTDAKLFLESEKSLRNVYWFNRRVHALWCVQPGAHPVFQCPAITPEIVHLVQDSVLKGTPAISAVTSVNGNPRFFAVAPVRGNGMSGYLVAEFDARELTTSALHDQRPPDYAIEVSADGVPIGTLPNTAKPWPQAAYATTLQIENRHWSVNLIPAATDIQLIQRILLGFGLIMSSLIYLCTALAQIYRRNEEALRVEVGERRRAQDTIVQLNRDLQNQLDDFRTLIQVLPVGIAVSNDPECHDIWVNPRLASMLGISLDENISRSLPRSRPLSHRICRDGIEVPAEELPMQMAARTGRSQNDVETDIVWDDGKVLNTISYSAPVFDSAGKIRRVINVCVDVTERKQSDRQRKLLESKLANAEKYRSLGLMAAGIAHDFNNLLTAIIGQTELARYELLPDSRADHATQEVLAASKRAAELVSQLLAYTGHGWLALDTVNLSEEVATFKEELRELIPPHIRIDFDLLPNLPPIKADGRELRTVLRNLVANAVEAIGERSGTIQVRTQVLSFGGAELARDYPDQELRPGMYISLDVTDTGGGASPEVARRVFDPFFTTKFLGRGLGLSAVLGIMRAHHGGVRFDISAKQGVCVRILFPVAPAGQLRDRVA